MIRNYNILNYNNKYNENFTYLMINLTWNTVQSKSKYYFFVELNFVKKTFKKWKKKYSTINIGSLKPKTSKILTYSSGNN